MHPRPHGKHTSLLLVSIAELLAMTLWFSASAVVPQLTAEWQLSGAEQAWMTMSVQLGFVAGALLSAALNLADRFPVNRLMSASTLVAAVTTAAIPWLDRGPEVAIGLRFLTGAALAGVYPPGMKFVASWSVRDRGLWVGILVGALTVGSAAPHLFNALPLFGERGMPPWRGVLTAASLAALIAAAIAAVLQAGPHLGSRAPFEWRYAGHVLTDRPVRLANFGYLGHMWELYAMWTWAPIFLIASYQQAGRDLAEARLAGFATIAAGAIGCVLAGHLADRFGRTAITVASLALSGSCCIAAGFLFALPGWLTALCLVWGFAVVADSAQFSAAVTELSDPRYVGTMLTMQTSLGFLLTLATIHLVPPLVARLGWEYAFAVLALGPVFGIWSMLRLRALPEAARMAGGKR